MEKIERKPGGSTTNHPWRVVSPANATEDWLGQLDDP